MHKLLLALLPALFATAVQATEVAVAPSISAEGLPALGDVWRTQNPYRGDPQAITTGQLAYNQACARCHGADASTNAAPAPDLRQLSRFCGRIGDAELKAICIHDNDAYFAKTVRNGKVIVGVTHMPAWQGVLKQELAWAIQVFIESRVGTIK